MREGPPKFEVGRRLMLSSSAIFWIYGIIVFIINVHSAPTVLFTASEGLTTAKPIINWYCVSRSMTKRES